MWSLYLSTIIQGIWNVSITAMDPMVGKNTTYFTMHYCKNSLLIINVAKSGQMLTLFMFNIYIQIFEK